MDEKARKTNMYGPIRETNRKGRKRIQGEAAIIAAKFDSCCDKLTHLYFICLNAKQAYPEIDCDYTGELLALLKTWGDESGAYNQSLDRKLRLATGLRDHAANLLNDLQDDIQSGIDYLQTIESNIGSSIHGEDEDEDGSTGVAGNSEDMLVGGMVLEILDNAAITIEQLRLLSPELHDAHPTDLDRWSSSTSNSGDTNDSAEVLLATAMFPFASKALVSRLASANWKRRVALRMLRARRSNAVPNNHRKEATGRKKAARRDIAVDAFNFQQPEIRDPRIQSASKSIATDSSFQPSTVFSRREIYGLRSPTTFATSAAYSKLSQTEAEHSRILMVPVPPIDLESQNSFVCPFCDFELNSIYHIQGLEEWERHVFEDLMTYLCTYEECPSARKTYGAREDWYKHELLTHRVSMVWICGDCREEHDTKDHLAQHLVDRHGDEFSPAEASRTVSFLRPTHSRKPLKSQQCPLCPSPLDPHQVKEHVANHLEQLALTSLNEDDLTDEDVSDDNLSQVIDNNDVERGGKLATLQAFVEEQLQHTFKPTKHVEIIKVDENKYHEEDLDEQSPIQPTPNPSNVQAVANDREILVELNDPQRSKDVGSSTSLPFSDTRIFPRDEEFVGRTKELANMYKVLSQPGQVYVLSSQGGMGKTALAVEFTYLFQHSFHYIFWISAETSVGALESFNQIALKLDLAPAGTDQNTLTTLGREFLETVKDRKWLLIFDNVEKWEDIDVFSPNKTSATNGGILITTRHQAFTAPTRPLNYYRRVLGELAIDEGRELLIHGLPQELRPQTSSIRDPEFKIAGDIASLAGLPLAIIYIAGYMKAMNCKPSEFWSYWDSWLQANQNVSKFSEHDSSKNKLDSIMQMSVGDLGHDALQILRIMAFLDSDGVQRELLVQGAGDHGPNYLRPFRFRMILKELVSKHFVAEKKHESKEFYVIHRALQSRLLHELHANPKQREEVFRIAYDLIRAKLPRPSLECNDSQTWNQFREYMPHLTSLQRLYSDQLPSSAPTPFVGLAELFRDGGILLWQRYIPNDAMKLLSSAEKVLDDLEDDHDLLRVEIHITMNLLLQYFGISHRKESNDRLSKILEFRKKTMEKAMIENAVTDTEEILLINAYADYANSLMNFNNFEDAERIYENCYMRYLKISSEEDSPFAFAKLNHHLAYCKMYRGDFNAAINLAEKAVTLVSRLNDTSLVLRYQFDLACIMLQKGDMHGALRLHDGTLDARLVLLGRASYFTLQSQYAVGAIYSYLGQHEEAEQVTFSYNLPIPEMCG